MPFIYVNTDAAMASGREIGRYPKKIANIGLEQFGDEWRGYLFLPLLDRALATTGHSISDMEISSRVPTMATGNATKEADECDLVNLRGCALKNYEAAH